MSEMVDRVAKTLIVHMDSFGGLNDFAMAPATATWDEYSRVEQSAARFAARAVIRAMQEPTEAMVTNGLGRKSPKITWQTMIDEALS